MPAVGKFALKLPWEEDIRHGAGEGRVAGRGGAAGEVGIPARTAVWRDGPGVRGPGAARQSFSLQNVARDGAVGRGKGN